MLLGIVLNAQSLLIARVGSVDGAPADVGRTAEEAELFNDRDLGAVLKRGDRSSKPGTAAANDHDFRLDGVGEHGNLLDALFECAVGTGFLEGLAHGTLDGKARQRRARNAVDVDGLISDDAIGHFFDRELAHARRLEVARRDDLGDLSVFNRDVQIEFGVVTHHALVVGAVNRGCAHAHRDREKSEGSYCFDF